jgi:predicted ArsR family transcriptional regulator
LTEHFEAGVSGVAALAEPARRALYLYVSAQPEAVSREQAAQGCSLPRHTAKFHLDRLVEAGLLEVEFRRLSGRTGPGAGRPAKLYRRSDRQISVSLPDRRYDVAGHVLAKAIDLSLAEGTPLPEAVAGAAEAEGRRIAQNTDPEVPSTRRAEQVLLDHGYEPRRDETGICLLNCPFDALAREHKDLVCGMNLSLVGGVLDAVDCRSLEAVLDPEPGMCCVKAVPREGR